MELVAVLSFLGIIIGLVLLLAAVGTQNGTTLFTSITLVFGCILLLLMTNDEIGQDEKNYIKEHYLNPEYAACKEKVPDIIISKIDFSRYETYVKKIDKINEFKELRGEK